MALPAHTELELFLIYADGGHRLTFPMLERGRGMKKGEMDVMDVWLREEGKSYGLVDRTLAQEWEASCGACFDLAQELE